MQEIFVVTFKFPHGNIPFHFVNQQVAEEFLKTLKAMGGDEYIIDFDKIDMSLDKFNLYSSKEQVLKTMAEQFQNTEAIKEVEERLGKFYKKENEKSFILIYLSSHCDNTLYLPKIPQLQSLLLLVIFRNNVRFQFALCFRKPLQYFH